MKFRNRIQVTPQDYLQKRYEVAKDVLSGVITQEKLDSFSEAKQQESLIFNCISLADTLLKELGYFYKTNNAQAQDETSVRNLSELMGEEDEEN